ncbi:MAG: hypothetical protein ABL901_01040 [Hyphomicrobiaceae bacterium]
MAGLRAGCEKVARTARFANAARAQSGSRVPQRGLTDGKQVDGTALDVVGPAQQPAAAPERAGGVIERHAIAACMPPAQLFQPLLQAGHGQLIVVWL